MHFPGTIVLPVLSQRPADARSWCVSYQEGCASFLGLCNPQPFRNRMAAPHGLLVEARQVLSCASCASRVRV